MVGTTLKKHRDSELERAREDREWWEDRMTPGWYLVGWTDRKAATFCRLDGGNVVEVTDLHLELLGVL